MPRYHFHHADGGFIPDTEGTELPNIDGARAEALIYAAEMIRDRPNLVWNGRDFRVEVTDESDALLCTVVVLGIESVATRRVLADAAK